MTEEAPSQIIYLQKPTQCVLWEYPDRIRIGRKFSDLLEAIESYEDTVTSLARFTNAASVGSFIFTNG